VKTLQTFRFALDPSARVERALESHVGARRFVFNWGLALIKARLDACARGEAVEVPWTLPALRREWNRAKASVAPWWRDNSKEAYTSGLEGLAHALKAWSESHKGRRKGRRMGFPRFRKKGRCRESVGFTTGAIRVDDESHVVLPRIGRGADSRADNCAAEAAGGGHGPYSASHCFQGGRALVRELYV